MLRSIRVLHEDDHLLAVAKPAGMAVHGGAGEDGPTLIGLLRAAYHAPVALDLAHRLDRPTSGVVLLAKSKAVLRGLQAAWEGARKTYLAIALGTIPGDRVIDDPVADRDGGKRAASTALHVIAHLGAIRPDTTLVSLVLGTGRTHQIRLHLAGIGHPVLLDQQHGDFDANRAWLRALQGAGAARPKYLMLHALRLNLQHPVLKTRVRLSAEAPPAWAEVLRASGAAVDALHEVP